MSEENDLQNLVAEALSADDDVVDVRQVRVASIGDEVYLAAAAIDVANDATAVTADRIQSRLHQRLLTEAPRIAEVFVSVRPALPTNPLPTEVIVVRGED